MLLQNTHLWHISPLQIAKFFALRPIFFPSFTNIYIFFKSPLRPRYSSHHHQSRIKLKPASNSVQNNNQSFTNKVVSRLWDEHGHVHVHVHAHFWAIVLRFLAIFCYFLRFFPSDSSPPRQYGLNDGSLVGVRCIFGFDYSKPSLSLSLSQKWQGCL